MAPRPGPRRRGGRRNRSLLPKSISLPMASTSSRTSTPSATLAASAVQERRRRCRPACSRRSAGGCGRGPRRCPRACAGSSAGRAGAARRASRSPGRRSWRDRPPDPRLGDDLGGQSARRPRPGSRRGRAGRSDPRDGPAAGARWLRRHACPHGDGPSPAHDRAEAVGGRDGHRESLARSSPRGVSRPSDTDVASAATVALAEARRGSGRILATGQPKRRRPSDA